MNSRRTFLHQFSLFGAAMMLGPACDVLAYPTDKSWFRISLAQWSLHRTIRKGDLKNIDFPAYTAQEFGIFGVEYVNSFFKEEVRKAGYLNDLSNRAKDHNVTNVLIMVDGEGDLGDAHSGKRKKAVQNHYLWVDAAHALGCHAIRVNAAGKGSKEDVADRVVESLNTLSEYAISSGINVVVENHGGISSHGDWLSSVLSRVQRINCGSLPDFGNFYAYDRYKGVAELMPFAKGISAKTHDFTADGMEKDIDYNRMMNIIQKEGYKGYIGIEYEGDQWSEVEGIKRTKKLLERYQ